MDINSSEETKRPELIFALVGPAGTRLEDLSTQLKKALATFGYKVTDIRLSDLLHHFDGWTDQKGTSEFDRITHLQEMGNAFRAKFKDGAALARAGIAEIRKRRAEITGNPDQPAPNRAYILRQLKHPDEVDYLHEVYGSSFMLIAGHAPRGIRVDELARQMAQKASRPGQDSTFHGRAEDVIEADEKQADDFGQNTRDTYPKSDFFANLAGPGGEHKVHRFVDLLFGHPFRTPSPEEYAMYQANAVSLRSSDDNRQVGAAIVSLTRDINDYIKDADIIAVGMNEVPRGGGGFYWDTLSPDNRDQALLQGGEDRATDIKISALTELIEKMREKGLLRETLSESADILADSLLPEIKRTQFMNIGEFSRPVHAEMAALIDAARRGVAVNGQTMYVTTFPCHNCAKHIIAAGILRVVYLEPYPKSRATHLHREEIFLESKDGKVVEGKVVFYAFSGIAPRQYRQLFSMAERGAKKGNSLKKWNENKLSLLPIHVTRGSSLAYLCAEREELEKLPTEHYKWDKSAICPSLKK